MSTLDQLYRVLSATLAELKDKNSEPDYKRIQAINDTAGAMTAVARLEIDFRKLKTKNGGTFFPALPEESVSDEGKPAEAERGVVTRLTAHGKETITPAGPAGVVRHHVLK
jgi:hypothetical protein